MNTQIQIITPLVISAIISFVLVYIAWRRRESRVALAFMYLMIAIGLWTTFYIGEIVSETLEQKLFFAGVLYFGAAPLGPLWLIFTSTYTGQDEWLSSIRTRILLWIIPGVAIILSLTNQSHLLMRTNPTIFTNDFGIRVITPEYGIFFWLFAVYTYTLLLIGSFFIARAIIRSPSIYRSQFVILLIGVLSPWIANVVFLINPDIFSELDPTPLAFTATGVAFAWALFRYQLLDIIPIARDRIVENMTDGVIVLDGKSRVVDMNPAARNLFQTADTQQPIGMLLTDFLADYPHLGKQFSGVYNARTEVSLDIDEATLHFDLSITPIQRRRQSQRGRLIVFRNITEKKKTERELINQKQLFENLVNVARATTEMASLDATLKNVLTIARDLTNAEIGSLFLLNEQNNVTHSILARGDMPLEDKRPLLNTVMDSGLAGWVAKNRKPALITDTSEDARWVKVAGHPPKVHSVLAVPIMGGEIILGVLTLEHTAVAHFSKADVKLMVAAGDQMALALRNAQIHDARQRHTRRQNTLYKILRGIGSHRDVASVLKSAVKIIAQEIDIPSIAILLPNAEKAELIIEYAAGHLSGARGRRIRTDQGITGRAYLTREIQYVLDVSKDPDYISGADEIKSELDLPLVFRGRLFGVISFARDVINGFNKDDTMLAESLADAIALSLDNAYLYEETQKGLREQTMLREAGELIVASIDTGAVLRTVAEQMSKAIDATSAYILSYDPETNKSTLMAEFVGARAVPEEYDQDDATEWTEEDETFLTDMRRGRVVTSKLKDGPFTTGHKEMESSGVQSILYVPFRVRRDFIGYAELWESRYERDFTEDEINLCINMSIQAAFALQRARLFDEINLAREAAEAANIAKSEFISVVAHELNGPMTTIKGFAEMLAIGSMGEVNDTQQDMLGVIQQTIDRMSLLVSDLADISRIESGNLKIKLADIDLREIIAMMTRDIAHQVEEKKQHFIQSVPETLPKIIADSNRLVQVLTNLASNAVKYTPEGGKITLRVCAPTNGQPADFYLQIDIEDNGIGISPEDQEKLFQKFFRSPDQLARKVPGTGLGLSIARNLIELQGGEIWLTSELRKGTKISFTIPISASKS